MDVFTADGREMTIVARDIEEGEELTCDYALFDPDLVEGRYSI